MSGVLSDSGSDSESDDADIKHMENVLLSALSADQLKSMLVELESETSKVMLRHHCPRPLTFFCVLSEPCAFSSYSVCVSDP